MNGEYDTTVGLTNLPLRLGLALNDGLDLGEELRDGVGLEDAVVLLVVVDGEEGGLVVGHVGGELAAAHELLDEGVLLALLRPASHVGCRRRRG